MYYFTVLINNDNIVLSLKIKKKPLQTIVLKQYRIINMMALVTIHVYAYACSNDSFVSYILSPTSLYRV